MITIACLNAGKPTQQWRLSTKDRFGRDIDLRVSRWSLFAACGAEPPVEGDYREASVSDDDDLRTITAEEHDPELVALVQSLHDAWDRLCAIVTPEPAPVPEPTRY